MYCIAIKTVQEMSVLILPDRHEDRHWGLLDFFEYDFKSLEYKPLVPMEKEKKMKINTLY